MRGALAKCSDGGSICEPMADPTATGVHRLEVDPASTQRLLLNEYDRFAYSGYPSLSQSSAGNLSQCGGRMAKS